ncbi:MAG TPA: trypsin-like peptidase domain-containing protein [Anaerolineae bacterium]|nr:trypsin-like peptidase domain-containing protein [Anaerolineales bacterium]HSD82615.1 trypsin-like peptidase domain-containing protein [Anaerolineae bacterium]
MNEPSLSVSDRLRERIRRLRERARKTLPFLSGVLAALLALFLYNTLSPGTRPLTQNEVSTAISSALASATPRPAFSEQVYKIIQPSLVWIESDSPGVDGKTETGLGTGVIINQNGDILTALHVVDHATSIKVAFADGTESMATMSSSQPEKDIAVLQAQTLPQPFLPAVLGNARAMQVGDEAYVVGNPFGLYSSMSAGVISGFDRTFQPQGSGKPIEGLIQVDAAINPGNSGGPLLNRSGQVVGIVTGIVNPTNESFFVGIGFAVPIDTAAGGAGLPPY